MEPAETFWNRLLEVGEYAGADVWIAFAAVVTLSLTTAIFVLCMWGTLRALQRQVSDFLSYDYVPDSGASETHEVRLVGLASNATFDAAGLESRIVAAEALARRLDALQVELDQQVASRRDIVARLDTQLRQQCIQLTTGLLRTEGLRQSPMVEIDGLATEVGCLNRLFEPVSVVSPEKKYLELE